MKTYEVTFTETHIFYKTELIEAENEDDARATASALYDAGTVEFDFLSESIRTDSGVEWVLLIKEE